MRSFLGGLAFGWERVVYRIPISNPPPKKKINKTLQKKNTAFFTCENWISSSLPQSDQRLSFCHAMGFQDGALWQSSRFQWKVVLKKTRKRPFTKDDSWFFLPIFGQEMFFKRFPEKKRCVWVYMCIHAGNNVICFEFNFGGIHVLHGSSHFG